MFQSATRFVHPAERATAAVNGLSGAGAEGDAPSMIRRRSRSGTVAALLVAAAAALCSSTALAQEPCAPPDGEPSEARTKVCAGASLTKGQQRIHQGRFQDAIAVFTCVIDAAPLTVDAYRGRAEAKLMLGRFSDAFRDYARLNAVVVPTNPNALADILASYDARLVTYPNSVPARTGAAFAHWTAYDFAGSLPHIDVLLSLNPNNIFANLFRGSDRLFLGVDIAGGIADFDYAIELAPRSPDVRFIVADGFTYAYRDSTRAFAEASLALEWGLDTPRIHAILASAYNDAGDIANSSYHLDRHMDLVTTQLVTLTSSLDENESVTVALAAGKTYAIPIPATAGDTISIATSSPSGEIWDSILVLYSPSGAPVNGSDDYVAYYAGLDWVAPESGTYTMWVTSFEGVSTGELLVSRD
jgi:tetratricopeptide (TPR) repeat protein